MYFLLTYLLTYLENFTATHVSDGDHFTTQFVLIDVAAFRTDTAVEHCKLCTKHVGPGTTYSTAPGHVRQATTYSTAPDDVRHSTTYSTAPGHIRHATTYSTAPDHVRHTTTYSTAPGHVS